MQTLKILVAQVNVLVGDIQNNAKRVVAVCDKAAKQYQADVVLLPELVLSGYPPEDLLLRSGFYTRINRALEYILQSVSNITLILGYPQKIKNKIYNQAAVVQTGKIVATYAKHYLPNYTVFDEKRYFTEGTEPCLFKVKGIHIGLGICEDLWYPDPIQGAVDAGAQLILSLNASPYDCNKFHTRENTLKQRASETKTPIIYCNLVGGQDELVFDGGSMVIDSSGQRVQQAPTFQEALMPVDFAIDEIQSSTLTVLSKTQPPPGLEKEASIYQALVLGVHDYVTKNQFDGVLIGLSGGIDSALTLMIAYDALGANAIHAVMMPSRFTSGMSIEDAKTQAKRLQIDYQVIAIDSLFEHYLNTLKTEFANTSWGVAEENIQARIRSNLLMAIANKKNNIVLATSNKSELAVGYTTLYGDMSGGFAPLKDVFKTMVYRLADYRNTQFVQNQYPIPQRVLKRPPSAELAQGQKDQDTLPPYSALDAFLERYIEADEDVQDFYAANLDSTVLDKVIRRINSSEHKRRQAPIGIRITQKAFGKDRRYPITAGYYKVASS